MSSTDTRTVDHFFDDEEEDFDYSLIENNDVYSWEGCYDKTWESIFEERSGLVREQSISASQTNYLDNKPESTFTDLPTRKGILRTLVIVLDASESMQSTDYKPNRLSFVLSSLEHFLNLFYSWNPLGRVALLAMMRNNVFTLSSLSETLNEKIKVISKFKELVTGAGSVSLYSGLHKISQETKGTYLIAKNSEGFSRGLSQIKNAPDFTPFMKIQLVPVAFVNPYRSTTVTMCICHNQPSFDGFMCPRCSCKTCEIPSICRICNLYLSNSLDIFQTTHQFKILPASQQMTEAMCQCCMCMCTFQRGGYTCTVCKAVFCHYCNQLKYSSLQYCPKCHLNQLKKKKNCDPIRTTKDV